MMKIIEYKIKEGDTLESIAKGHHITVKELIEYHNQQCGIASLIIHGVLPIHLEFVLINSEVANNKIYKNVNDNKISFQEKATYRTEQLNITRIEDDIKSYSELKKEYDVQYKIDEKIVSVKLNDFYYEFNPPALSRIFDFISKIDYIRNDCVIGLNDYGRFSKIVDKKKQSEKWNSFKKEDLNYIEFVNVVKQTKPAEYENLINQGDIQFSENYSDKNDFNRDLFYLILLDKYLVSNPEDMKQEVDNYQSQLFPDVNVPMNLRYDIIKKENDIITVRKVWETIESSELLEKVNNAYEKYHQPLIKYKFTNYKLDMRCLLIYNNKTKIIEKAEMSIIENIENNIKSECIFNIKKIER